MRFAAKPRRPAPRLEETPRFEEIGGRRLPLGGLNYYLGVRGGQGRKKNKFQGVKPKKKHRTGLFDTPVEAALAFAQLKEDLELDMLELEQKSPAEPDANAAAKKSLYLGQLFHQAPPAAIVPARALPLVVPTVRAVLLTPPQAASAAARNVALAYAEPLA